VDACLKLAGFAASNQGPRQTRKACFMDINVEFSLEQPLPAVWAALQDIPAVISCVPGLELTGQTGKSYHTKLKIKLGPVAANFTGESYISSSSITDKTGCIEGKGVDKNGGTSVTYKTVYRLTEEHGATQVQVDANIGLTGTLSRMSRVGIFQDVAEQLADQFCKDFERQFLTQSQVDAANTEPTVPTSGSSVSAIALLFAALRRRTGHLIRSIFSHSSN
jgi:carbon monoxide dehydrogenase subunit G